MDSLLYFRVSIHSTSSDSKLYNQRCPKQKDGIQNQLKGDTSTMSLFQFFEIFAEQNKDIYLLYEGFYLLEETN